MPATEPGRPRFSSWHPPACVLLLFGCCPAGLPRQPCEETAPPPDSLPEDSGGCEDPSRCDLDGDGLSAAEGDCDDGDPEVSPLAEETWYDGVDGDCDGAHAIDVLYRTGTARQGRFEVIVVDTPPVKKGGCMPGVLLVTPTDGDDASANLIWMLRATPASTEIVLVRIDRVPKSEWAHDAGVIAEASNRTEGLGVPSRSAAPHRRGPRGAEPGAVGLDVAPAWHDARLLARRRVAGRAGLDQRAAGDHAPAARSGHPLRCPHPRLG